MANPFTLYRFRIDLSDVDRNLYQLLDFRVAMHPSEIAPYLLTRVIAYALNWQEGLEFSPGGLSNSDDPTLSVRDPGGKYDLWIEIGNPSARKLHKAAKAASKVRVYSYKNPELLLNEIHSNKVHRADEIEIFSIPSAFLDRLASSLERDNRWHLTHNELSLVFNTEGLNLQAELIQHSLT